MLVNDKETILKFSETFKKLNENEQNYVLGLAEGMAIVKETQKPQKEQKLHQIT